MEVEDLSTHPSHLLLSAELLSVIVMAQSVNLKLEVR